MAAAFFPAAKIGYSIRKLKLREFFLATKKAAEWAAFIKIFELVLTD
jgi:hypothetical protein